MMTIHGFSINGIPALSLKMLWIPIQQELGCRALTVEPPERLRLDGIATMR